MFKPQQIKIENVNPRDSLQFMNPGGAKILAQTLETIELFHRSPGHTRPMSMDDLAGLSVSKGPALLCSCLDPLMPL
eukprot:316725-Pelagomonas_calceolata.AAC.1